MGPLPFHRLSHTRFPRSCVIHRKDTNITILGFGMARFYRSIMVGLESATRRVLAHICEERKVISRDEAARANSLARGRDAEA
jgi:hypothetical protein